MGAKPLPLVANRQVNVHMIETVEILQETVRRQKSGVADACAGREKRSDPHGADFVLAGSPSNSRRQRPGSHRRVMAAGVRINGATHVDRRHASRRNTGGGDTW